MPGNSLYGLTTSSTILTKLASHPFVGRDYISHIVSEYGKLAQKEYKRRHDSVRRYVHWQFCEKLRFNRARLWYEHEPKSVVENENFKILWDFTIQCDHMTEARRPNIVVVRKVKKETMIRRSNTRRYKSIG